MANKKMVVFGAGRIGRSFIGQLFSAAGYEIVFIDADRQLTDNINRSGKYRVVIRSDKGDGIITVKNVRAVCADDEADVINELAGADIAAVSVGQHGLARVVPRLAYAMLLRRKKYGDRPLDIILAENMRNADRFIAEESARYLPEDYPAEKLMGLVETSIGKMVPIMSQRDIEKDPLQVFAEPYNRLIVAREGFRNPVPDVANLEPKTNIKAWVDRKLFIHNLGHSAAAYLGHRKYPEAVYMFEVLDGHDIYGLTRKTMLESASILSTLHPGEFTSGQLESHIDDLLGRFRNRALGDTVFRAGCDLYRKLGPEDRLAAPFNAAIRLKKPGDLILNAIVCAISFRAKDENANFFPADKEFFIEAEKGILHILETVCGIDREVLRGLKKRI